MTIECLLALLVFLVTYALIAIHKIPGTKIGRAGIALIGGAAMLVLGLVSFSDIPLYINYELLLLLFGMMLLVAGLELAGFFEVIVHKLIAGNPSHIKFLVSLMLLSAFLSAIMLNDAVVLLLTPVVIKCCRSLKANPIPYLVGLFISSNIGSVATAVGNPQNAYIATKAGIGFLEFSIKTIPLAIIALTVAILIIIFFFKKDINEEVKYKEINNDDTVKIDRPRLIFMLGLLTITVVLFALSDPLGLPIYIIALASGIVALIAGVTKGIGNAVWMVKRVDWSIILFFVGLFILMGGVVSTGLIDEIASLFPGFGEGETPSILGIAAFSAVLSNLISNVPAVMLIGNMIPSQEMFWLVLAASSTLAGNATLIGAAANIIVAEESEKYDIKLNFWQALKIGLPVSFITLLICVGYFYIIY
ncbi:MAG: arsenic ABC transporter [Candidatus Methanogranum gryphiswaldense]|nr:MAG: arsenic ABC transporter [Candidatus Methanogranum sp. U3.2.1]